MEVYMRPVMPATYRIEQGDCLELLKDLPDNSIDAIVTDPPYGLTSSGKEGKGGGFMGKKWDSSTPPVEVWQECLRVLKPGGHMLAFGGTRTFHRLVTKIEDAGFEIREMLAWVHGQGFPKSLDITKAIDKRGGKSVGWFGPWLRAWREENGISQKQVSALFPSKTGGLTGCVANWELGLNLPTPEQFNLIRDSFSLPFDSLEEAEREVIGTGNKPKPTYHTANIGGSAVANSYNLTTPATEEAKQWSGWGSALKPSLEPITLARKPLAEKTIAENVLRYSTGALNIDASRIPTDESTVRPMGGKETNRTAYGTYAHDKAEKMYGGSTTGRFPSNLITDGSPEVLEHFPQTTSGKRKSGTYRGMGYQGADDRDYPEVVGDSGSAARFFKVCAPDAARIVYVPKASKRDRDEGLEGFPAVHRSNGNKWTDQDYRVTRGERPPSAESGPRRNHHPTVKSTELMRYLCRLITPADGTILDPFCGSGSTLKGALLEGFSCIGFELEPEYVEISIARCEHALAQAKKSDAQPRLFDLEEVRANG